MDHMDKNHTYSLRDASSHNDCASFFYGRSLFWRQSLDDFCIGDSRDDLKKKYEKVSFAIRIVTLTDPPLAETSSTATSRAARTSFQLWTRLSFHSSFLRFASRLGKACAVAGCAASPEEDVKNEAMDRVTRFIAGVVACDIDVRVRLYTS